MKRLLRVSFDIFISSVTPILTWLLLSVILDKKLINVFTLTYPLQCLSGILTAIFGMGASICNYKDNNKNSSNNGIFYGLLVSLVIFIYILFNNDGYIKLMNMNANDYHIFSIYSIIQLFNQTIVMLILNKLYYMEENKKANKISLLFNMSYFVITIVISLITFNQFLVMIYTSIIMSLFTLIILITNIGKIDFKLNFYNAFKYNSVSIVNNIFFFIIYLFGFKNSFAYGTKYIVAINLATLVTDLQWDIETSVSTVAKIDISKNKFVYKEHLKNALKLNIILISSVIVMSLIGVFIYKPNMFIFLIFIMWHIIDYMLTPFTNIKISYLQLEYSSLKTTFNEMIAFAIRTFMSFIPTPFCTIIGQMCSSIYEFTYSTIKFGKIRIGINKEN